MSSIYLKDTVSYSVEEAQKDRDRLESLNIRSPDISKQFKLKIDTKTVFYFVSKEKRSDFISKYYNRNTKRYTFEQKQNETDNLNN